MRGSSTQSDVKNGFINLTGTTEPNLREHFLGGMVPRWRTGEGRPLEAGQPHLRAGTFGVLIRTQPIRDHCTFRSRDVVVCAPTPPHMSPWVYNWSTTPGALAGPAGQQEVIPSPVLPNSISPITLACSLGALAYGAGGARKFCEKLINGGLFI